MEKAAGDLQAQAPLHGLWLKKLIREKQLLREYPAGSELVRRLAEYSQCVLTYYKRQYREELFEEKEGEFLPPDCRFALYASKALKRMGEQRFPDAVHLFRSALRVYPAMTGVVQEVIRQMKNRMENPVPDAGEEFRMLAGQMKQSLSMLAEQGQYAQAQPVMQQLCSLLPEDLELLRIRQRLLVKMSGERKNADAMSILR